MMRTISRATMLILALSYLLAACGEPADRGGGATPDGAVATATVTDSVSAVPPTLVALEDYIAQGAIAHGLTRAQVIARFGEPAEVSSTPTPNRHDPSVIDSVVQIAYPGARYTFYVVSAGPGEILDGAEIRSNDHLHHTVPGIGTRVDDLRAAWGAPVRADAAEIEYECRTCEVPEPVTFEVENGSVRGVRFDYYVD